MSNLIARRPVRRAHEQVYDQLLEAMLGGSVPNEGRLPSELELATAFDVSRSTIRLALGLLQSQGLIRTSRGPHGGSFVTLPTISHISEFLQRNLELLSLKNDVTLDEFLEARRLLEGFAVRQAAVRRKAQDVKALRATLTPSEPALSAQEQYLHNREFHLVLVDACGNSLLRIAALPIFTILHTNLERSALTPEFSRRICDDHAPILDAIEQGDPDQAEQLMLGHLSWLSGVYRRIWKPSGAPAAQQLDRLAG